MLKLERQHLVIHQRNRPELGDRLRDRTPFLVYPREPLLRTTLYSDRKKGKKRKSTSFVTVTTKIPPLTQHKFSPRHLFLNALQVRRIFVAEFNVLQRIFFCVGTWGRPFLACRHLVGSCKLRWKFLVITHYYIPAEPPPSHILTAPIPILE